MSKCNEKICMVLCGIFFFAAIAFAGTCDYEDAKRAEKHQLTQAQRTAVIATWNE